MDTTGIPSLLWSLHDSCVLMHVPATMHTHSFELRELEAKLKAAYLNKERAAQLAEKDTLKKKEEVKERGRKGRHRGRNKDPSNWIIV